MSSGNQNWRFYLTSSFLGNCERVEISVTFLITCMSSGNQNWKFYLTSSFLGNWDRLEITSLACPQGTRIGGFL
jgi:hypothetical protein